MVDKFKFEGKIGTFNDGIVIETTNLTERTDDAKNFKYIINQLIIKLLAMIRMEHLDFGQSVRDALNSLFHELCSLVPTNGQTNDFAIEEVDDETNISPAPINTNIGQVGYQNFQWLLLMKLSG